MVGALAALAGPALAQAKANAKTLVCKHGCVYTTIQSAVNHSGRGATIDVKPGKYVEGVVVRGHTHDGLRIIGMSKKPAGVLLEGKNAHGPEGAAQNAVEGDNVNNLTAYKNVLGTTRWTVKDNSIFGNFLWGAAAFSDPTNNTGKAVNIDNTVKDNKMGAALNDANGSDFFNDGSGHGTCFANNGSSVTLDTNPTISAAALYPACPATAGTGTVAGNPTQVLKLAAVVLAKPPTTQENYWHVHAHPARKGRKPYKG
jgi:ribosomal protein S5